MITIYSKCIEMGHFERLQQSPFNVFLAVFSGPIERLEAGGKCRVGFPGLRSAHPEPVILSRAKRNANIRECKVDEREYAPRLAAGNRSSGDPRGYAPLVAGRGSMPRPRKGGRERSDRWKGETRSGFPPKLPIGIPKE